MKLSKKLQLGFLLPVVAVVASAFGSPAQAAMLIRQNTPAGEMTEMTPAVVQIPTANQVRSAVPAANQAQPMQTSQARSLLREPGENYIGVGGSNDGFVVNGKYALNSHVSLRPEYLSNVANDSGQDGTAVLAPVTYDFGSPAQRLHPFVGAGPGITTGGDRTNLQLATTAGADYRIGKHYTADAAVNYLPFDNADNTDFAAGVGYNF